MNILELPIEILTIIATKDFETFKAAILVPGLGPRLCCEYSQNYAKGKFIKIIIDNRGFKKYYTNDVIHRVDGPAFISDTSSIWCRNGIAHREDGPAIECKDGSCGWMINGQYHRVDGPAIINSHGEFWFINGNLHREDGPAVTQNDGCIKWYKNGNMINVNIVV
jgi:hypothetical protein